MGGEWERSALARIFGLGVIVAPLLLVFLGSQRAVACQDPNPGSSSHTVNGVNHGFSRVWLCTGPWKCTGFTNHGHGSKVVSLIKSLGGLILCTSVASGSANANCFATTTSNVVQSYIDTGAAGGCDTFNDGHGICEHFMEPIP